MPLIKNTIKKNKTRQNKGYVEVEIESYDHKNIYTIKADEWATRVNAKNILKYDLKFAVATNTANPFSLSKTINIDEYGEYQILIYGLTHATHNQFIELKINNIKIDTTNIKSVDEFIRSYNFGRVHLKEGENTITITGEKNCTVGMVVLKRIKRFRGNSDGEGDLKILDVEFTDNGVGEKDTFKMEILHHPTFEESSTSDFHRSGLVFEFMDSVNIRMGERRNNITDSFGGYIISPMISNNGLTISITGKDRCFDMDRINIIKEIVIAGGSTTKDDFKYNASNLHDAINYCLEAMEFKLLSHNLQEILDNEIPVKFGLEVDCGNSIFYNKFVTSNMTKKQINNTTKGSVLELQNHSKANTTQTTTIFDSSKNIIRSTPLKLDSTDANIFFVEYGLEGEKPETKTITETVTTVTKLKNGKTVTNTKTVKKTITLPGYNKSSPFLCWFKIEYSNTPTGALKTVNIDFTSNTSINKIGSITPMIENNFWIRHEFDVKAALDIIEPGNDFYIRKISLETKTPAEDLYDPTQEDSKLQYKLLFKRFGFRSGTPIIPEELKASGQSIETLLKTILDKTKLVGTIDYGLERRYDILKLEKEGAVLCNFDIIVGENCEDIGSISYNPDANFTNAVTKVYKSGDNFQAIRKVHEDSIAHYGTYDTVETMPEESGEFYSKYKAIADLEENGLPKWSYTAEIYGLPIDCKVGRAVKVITEKPYLNDIKIIKSKTVKYDSKNRQVTTQVGLDKYTPEHSSQKNIIELKNLIKVTHEMKFSIENRTSYWGGARHQDSVDIPDN